MFEPNKFGGVGKKKLGPKRKRLVSVTKPRVAKPLRCASPSALDYIYPTLYTHASRASARPPRSGTAARSPARPDRAGPSGA